MCLKYVCYSVSFVICGRIKHSWQSGSSGESEQNTDHQLYSQREESESLFLILKRLFHHQGYCTFLM